MPDQPTELEASIRSWSPPASYDAAWMLKDTLLYAIAVGARPSSELSFVYERFGPQVIPTFATRLAKHALEDFGTHLMRSGLTTVLYATTLECAGQLPPECSDATTTASVGELRNAGRHLLIDLHASTAVAGDEVSSITHTIWARDAAMANLPSSTTERDSLAENAFRFVDEVRDEQYVIWRLQENLSLDAPFPDQLHIDPEHNAQHGLGPPFITGECTLGFACRALLRCVDGPLALERMTARFRAPVVPGDSLVTTVEMRDAGQAAFEVCNGDGRVVLSDGRAVLRSFER